MTFGETVGRIRETPTGAFDRYGNATFTTAEVVVVGAAFAPAGTRIPVEVGREMVIEVPTLYWRTQVDAVPSDQWRVRGVVYDTDADPAEWVDPFGSAVGGTVIQLKAVGDLP